MKQISWIQRIVNNSSGTSASSAVVTVGAGITSTAGNSLILHCRLSGGFRISSITDTKSNTWTEDLFAGTSATISIWRCYLTTPLVANDQITLTFNGSASRALAVHEFTGISNVSPKDVTAYNSSAGSASAGSAGPTGSLAVPRELVFTAVATNQNTTYTEPSGYAPLDTGLAAARTSYAAYLLDTDKTAKSVTWNWGATGTWAIGIVTYQAFPSGGVNLLSGVG